MSSRRRPFTVDELEEKGLREIVSIHPHVVTAAHKERMRQEARVSRQEWKEAWGGTIKIVAGLLGIGTILWQIVRTLLEYSGTMLI